MAAGPTGAFCAVVAGCKGRGGKDLRLCRPGASGAGPSAPDSFEEELSTTARLAWIRSVSPPGSGAWRSGEGDFHRDQ